MSKRFDATPPYNGTDWADTLIRLLVGRHYATSVWCARQPKWLRLILTLIDYALWVVRVPLLVAAAVFGLVANMAVATYKNAREWWGAV